RCADAAMWPAALLAMAIAVSVGFTPALVTNTLVSQMNRLASRGTGRIRRPPKCAGRAPCGRSPWHVLRSSVRRARRGRPTPHHLDSFVAGGGRQLAVVGAPLVGHARDGQAAGVLPLRIERDCVLVARQSSACAHQAA